MVSIRRIAACLILLISAGALFAAGSNEAASLNDTVKAGFVYVGPAGDYGWTYAHDVARLQMEEEFPWLETVFVESVPEGDAGRIIDRMVQQEGCNIIFTTSFGYMDDTITAGKKYPDVTFMHCSGFKQLDNVGTFFGDLYQIYYLNGLMAGALTKSDKIGYVGAFPTPEVVRHIDAFALGAKAVNPDVEVHVRWIYAWYGPDKAKEAAESLISEGCDALAFTEDTPAVIEVGQDNTESGKQIYTFSHYSPMQQYGTDTVVSGQLIDWSVLYRKILADYRNGEWTNEDLWWLADTGVALLGGAVGEIINPKFEDDLRKVTVDDPDFGTVSVYELVLKRYEQMTTEGTEAFDPFDGPIYDNQGNLQIADGEKASKEHLLSMMYYVDNIVGTVPSE